MVDSLIISIVIILCIVILYYVANHFARFSEKIKSDKNKMKHISKGIFLICLLILIILIILLKIRRGL